MQDMLFNAQLVYETGRSYVIMLGFSRNIIIEQVKDMSLIIIPGMQPDQNTRITMAKRYLHAYRCLL